MVDLNQRLRAVNHQYYCTVVREHTGAKAV